MAFKTASQYNEERYHNLFMLRNDGDYADVIIMYRDLNDVLVADTHYIKSPEYSGYVHCPGKGCPACAKGIRTQTKLFIPVYDIASGKILFFDRNLRFEPVLQSEVFQNYPVPCDYVIRITRRGEAGDYDTRYEFQAVQPASVTYEEICEKLHTSFPEEYENVCRDVDAATLSTWLNSSSKGSGNKVSGSPSAMPNYSITPRTGIKPPEDLPNIQPSAGLDEIEDDSQEELTEEDSPNFD